MALQMNFTTKHGVSITDAYITVDCNKSIRLFNGCKLYLCVFNSSSDLDKGPQEKISFIIPSSDSIYSTYFLEDTIKEINKSDWSQAYSYIKSLDGTQSDGPAAVLSGNNFTTATDV